MYVSTVHILLSMIRTQIYLPKRLYEDVKLRAGISGKPAAEAISQLIRKGLALQEDT